MPSFDVVSQVDLQEVRNAVNNSNKEISTRYDFKKSNSKIELTDDGVWLYSDDEFKIKAVEQVLKEKLVKRQVPLRAMSFGKIEQMGLRQVKQLAKIQQGIPEEKAKQIVKLVKKTGLRVQSQIMGDQVRISGKKRDALQEVIALLKDQDLGIDMRYINFRD
ncbi:MAG: YajQ family cyclic di-GMP-binding protein [Candidatus Alcyoniella australis]|nr:YajQ family cyclic di-GMP-binding protein [Candidatus Alcyoniella australis]